MRLTVPTDQPVTHSTVLVPYETPFGVMENWRRAVEFGGATYHLLNSPPGSNPIQPAIDVETGDVVELDFSAVQVR